MTSVLSVEAIGKAYSGVHAVKDVSFSVDAGEIIALIGPNGAGKTTTFNMVGGQIRPDAGRILLAGRDITGLPPRQIWGQGAGRTFQIAQTFNSMSVVENVQMAVMSFHRETRNLLHDASTRYRAEAMALLETIGMAFHAQKPCGSLAYAEIKRVEFAIAMAGEPRLLLMDEPTAGMSLKDRATLMALVAKTAREKGLAILFTEHDINAVFTHADRIIVLVRGAVIATGTPDVVRNDPLVRAGYLGRHAERAHP